MLKTLLRKQLLELNRSFFQSSKNGKGRSRLVTVLLITGYVFLVVVVLGGIFTAMAYAMCAPMMAVQMDWLYFLIVSGVAAALGLFGSVFSTYSGLYMAKDNDLLLSMPIPVYAILASRLIGVYLMDLMFVAVVMIPAIVMYAIQGAAWTGVLCAIAFMMMLSLLVLCLACALGWVVARISVKMKKKSVVTALLSPVGHRNLLFRVLQGAICDTEYRCELRCVWKHDQKHGASVVYAGARGIGRWSGAVDCCRGCDCNYRAGVAGDSAQFHLSCHRKDGNDAENASRCGNATENRSRSAFG